LTSIILKHSPKAIDIVELDPKMFAIMQDRINTADIDVANTTIKLFRNDVLKFEPEFEDYIVIANIPYYITSPILSHFFYKVKNHPKEMIILMQKDV
jgi:16S rRNA A1518/A1519 N6-dimethyltransferase RsmA/KsgA/DIM1 with predicted DNA glycosylase/AP lyase activity